VENSNIPNLVDTKKPKLNVQTVSSAVFGKGGGAGESIKTIFSTIAELSEQLKNAVTRIDSLEEKILSADNLKPNDDSDDTNVSSEDTESVKDTSDTEDTEGSEVSEPKESNNSLKSFHKKISKLASHLRKAVVRIGALEKKVDLNTEKLNKIDISLKDKDKDKDKDNKLNKKDNTEKTLVETNKILVKIQKELVKVFGIQSSEDRKNKNKMLRDKSRKKLAKEESGLERSSRRLGESVSGAAENIIAPVGNIFSKIMEFLGIMLLGIAANWIFAWLKNPENMEKVMGWWNWIKDHWQWVAAGIGALMLLPLIGAITSVLGPIGLAASVIKMAMMPLIGLLFNPLFWKALLIIGAGVLLYKAGEAAFKGIRNATTGGSEFSAAHDVLDQKLRDAGLDQDGKKRDKGAGWDFLGWAGTRKEVAMTDDEKAISESVLAKRKQLNEMRDKMRGEIKDKHSDMDKNSGLSGMSSQDEVNKHNQSKSEAERGIRAEYGDKISQLVPEVNIDSGTNTPPVEARKMGGPIKAGKPYLVGETGPELVVPNIGGQVITSERTERMYKNLTSRKRGRGGVNIQSLPPITNQLPPPEVNVPSAGEATQVPDIPSVNSGDRYRQMSASIYGIMV